MKFVLIAAFFASSPAFAISNQEIVDACQARGVQKVVSQAQAFGCTVDPQAVKATDVDNREGNPSKYIWFSAPAIGTCAYPEITKLVQYYEGKCI